VLLRPKTLPNTASRWKWIRVSGRVGRSAAATSLYCQVMMQTLDQSLSATYIRPRIASRGWKDFLLVTCIVLPVQLTGLLIVPAALVYAATHSWIAAWLAAAVIYVVCMSLVVTALRITSEGIHFIRLCGSPKFLSWKQIEGISLAPPKELIIYGWLWPPLPAREMTASLSCLQHYRIQWTNGYCYFPPADVELFEQRVNQQWQQQTIQDHSITVEETDSGGYQVVE